MRGALLHAEVLREFGRAPAGLQGLDYGGWSVERRTSSAAKARERARLVSMVEVARRAEVAKLAPPRCCAGCGASIPRVAHRRGRWPRWCSSRCYARWYARGRALTCGAPAEVPCAECGAAVKRPLHQRGPAKRFCGVRCQSRNAAKRRRSA